MTERTRTRIVDATEMLLARDGWANVSVRAVAAQAKVNLSAVSYHFGNFKSLKMEVLGRRLIPLNEERRQNLDDLQQRKAKPSLEEILRAYLDPLLKLSSSSDAGERAFLLVLVRNSIEPSEEYLSIVGNELSRHAKAVVEAVKQVVLGVSGEEIKDRLRFAIGAISRALATPTTRRLGWQAESIQHLLTFLVAGFKAPATTHRSRARLVQSL